MAEIYLTAHWLDISRGSDKSGTGKSGSDCNSNVSDDVLSRGKAAKNVHTSDDRNGWLSVDFALWIIPTHYTVRHSRGFGRSALRNWLFQSCRITKVGFCFLGCEMRRCVCLYNNFWSFNKNIEFHKTNFTISCQVSKDSKGWVTLRTHVDDNSLSEPGSTATWEIECPGDEKQVKVGTAGQLD
eukprot:sb/3471472/